MPTLVSKISNKIRDVSTVDLNGDGIADPVLVIPQTESGDSDFLVFSILVPDPSEVSTLPSGSDNQAWRDIAENKSIEIMTASVVRSSGNELNMQSTPNPEVYQSATTPYPPYYGAGYSMSSLFMTSMMMSMLFRPPFMWGGGFGYGYGYSGPMAVSTVQNRRGATTTALRKADPSYSASKTAGGRSVSSNKFRSTSKKTLNNIKSTKFRTANRNARATGLGSNRPLQNKTGVTKRTRMVPRKRSLFGGSRRMRGFGFGGFGRRRR